MARAPSLSRVLLPSLALAALLASSLPDRALAQEPASETTSCIDEAIRDELNARRRYRGVRERLFQKALRHELSVMGGIYSADLLSSWAQVQGAYTFHFSEALGLELSFAWTRAKSELVRIIENDRGIALLRVENDVYVYMGHLLWSLAYGKVRWFGGTISRFDFYLAVGGGITDNQTARGLTFSGGFGLKMYFGEWFALRLDVRDQVLQQEILGESEIVNNIAATFGLSIFMPFTQ
ncbi:MAG TPA: outer membrane beta-barrel domain-containing protein [Polyangiaceae bacterium LLY-WYZ-15_(1-7)]|nr:outer membrane beta-barrel domain-containing protein [Polyangiaceae bacterium LLY-WYZ-15_(1-7)]HJL12975.1 outer membrane beta-barrel domain-containing protein [Polyangiaceae bacterium LLY-WYZ-15_(1-7)]HJL28554.1 outer membrane beta-barrel domain-containing protein [Polyangiaceae bacterium LLY-WYZ-15_(1-7)]HJL39258.1 outer membrane beta-barrel domain-containing protein [Polyangiaceae bacterium LLY-WYZ-15_(1-7)]HJL45738.1 outer membrane beta-barrel domain-containing protein [Polyangiaceae bact